MKRSKWKGMNIKPEHLIKKTKSISRTSSVLPKLIGKSVKIHSGNDYKKVSIKKEMLGHKLGEFSKTRAEFSFKKKRKKKKN